MIRWILTVVDKCKPLLVRILPITFLRKVKKLLIESNYKYIEKFQIEKFEKNRYQSGVNLIGNIRAEIGLGQSCRLLANELNESKIDFSIYNYEQISSLRLEDHSWDHKISEELPYNVNLIHINPYELGMAYLKIDKSVWDYRYNIAFWLWELEKFPEDWKDCLPLLDEIWTPSEFASESIRKVTDKPVYTIPYYVTAPVENRYDREYFKLPQDKFLYLVMYDSNSTMERKNPMGGIEAYKKAFPNENDNVGIVVKINNPQKKDIDILKNVLKEYKNVYFITDILQKVQVNSLVKCVDVFVSLHRAEGFGLVLAEAMLLGTPTIATNWSSNTEFMNKDNSCLVDYTFITIQENTGAYTKGNRWAEPDVNQAAGYMLKLYEDQVFYEQIVCKAKEYASEKLGKEAAIAKIQHRLKKILEE